MIIELVGIVATLFILTSMLFKTNTTKGAIIMRSINLVGSAIFVVYGALLPAISTAILNAGLVLINGFHLIRLLKIKKQEINNLNEKNIESKKLSE